MTHRVTSLRISCPSNVVVPGGKARAGMMADHWCGVAETLAGEPGLGMAVSRADGRHPRQHQSQAQQRHDTREGHDASLDGKRITLWPSPSNRLKLRGFKGISYATQSH